MKNHNKNAKHTSPQIQNEVIQLCSEHIIDEIVKRANQSQGYCIVFDETTDRANVSKICLTIKYWRQEKIKEQFILFIDAYKEAELFNSMTLTGEIIAEIIYSKLQKIGLDPLKLIRIFTDACVTMTSPNCGAFASLKLKIPHLVHLLCLNHTSNLSLLLGFKSSKDIVHSISLLSDLKSFFKMSPKRDHPLSSFLVDKKYSKLVDLYATRWSETHNSVKRILDCYEEVY